MNIDLTYVIKNSNGMYVSTPGSHKSFCRKLKYCSTFNSYNEAKEECCGNEYPVSVRCVVSSYFLS